jgi:hypothetical protein
VVSIEGVELQRCLLTVIKEILVSHKLGIATQTTVAHRRLVDSVTHDVILFGNEPWFERFLPAWGLDDHDLKF